MLRTLAENSRSSAIVIESGLFRGFAELILAIRPVTAQRAASTSEYSSSVPITLLRYTRLPGMPRSDQRNSQTSGPHLRLFLLDRSSGTGKMFSNWDNNRHLLRCGSTGQCRNCLLRTRSELLCGGSKLTQPKDCESMKQAKVLLGAALSHALPMPCVRQVGLSAS
jgi:hypothetical protein